MNRALNLVGLTFGRLKVLIKVDTDKRDSYWNCLCECGNETIVCGQNLKRNRTTSCGCYRKEVSKNNNAKHNKVSSHLYKISTHILDRCNNENCKNYKDYGARGIKCLLGDNIEDVISSLEKVDGYFEKGEIDRIDNDGHYELGNLRWATRSQNVHNRRELQANNTSGKKGVSFDRERNKWKSFMAIEGKHYMRRFDSYYDAVEYRISLEEYYKLKQSILGGTE